jgi:hypothetical protein
MHGQFIQAGFLEFLKFIVLCVDFYFALLKVINDVKYFILNIFNIALLKTIFI